MRRKKIRLKYKKERVLFSDVLPYELPLIFSNRYFYRFLVKNGIHVESDKIVWNSDITEGALNVLSFIVDEGIANMKTNRCVKCDDKRIKKFQTIPFTYRILHKPTKSRELAVIHPRNQILMVDFYDKYKSIMLYYCGLDKYSLRHPNKVACYFYYRDKLHKTLIGRKTDSLELFFNEYENLRTFFSYKRYNNIYKFYEDYRYQRAEKKFTHLLKFDVQSCFDSIYTHSIAWATGGGKEIYKSNFNEEDKTFGSKWDKQMQLMNYNETNGIVIGPEFSRIFAEIILQHIDCSVSSSLQKDDYLWERDYVCYRYVDDYFFFYNNDACRNRAMELFDEKFREFKLSVSSEKTNEYLRPFVTDISRAKIRIDKLIDEEVQYHSVHQEIEEKVEDEADMVNNDDIEFSIDKADIDAAIQDKSWLHLNSRMFNQVFKTILVECNVEAKDVINYTLSRIGNKLCSDIKKFDKSFRILSRALDNSNEAENYSLIVNAKRKKEQMFVSFMEEVLDVLFFLYSSNKRVNTTLKVINILNSIIIHMDNPYQIKDNTIAKYSDPARDVVFKKIQDELSLVLKTTSVDPNTQLETLYFLIINKQLRSKYHFSVEELSHYLKRLSSEGVHNALTVTILLYYYGNEKRYSGLKEELLQKIREMYNSVPEKLRRKRSELSILTLDLLTCPYLTYQNKKEIAGLIGISEPELMSMLGYFRKQKYMFTKWTKVDITKELSAKVSQEVYA